MSSDVTLTARYGYTPISSGVSPVASTSKSTLVLPSNPLRPPSTIRFGLAAGGPVRLAVYDASGRLVRRLADDTYPAGRHAVSWAGLDESDRPVASGIYYLRLESGTEHRRVCAVVVR